MYLNEDKHLKKQTVEYRLSTIGSVVFYVSRLTLFATMVIDTLLAFRILLGLTSLSKSTDISVFITRITDVIIRPFLLTIPFTVNSSPIDIPTLLAVITYTILSLLFYKISQSVLLSDDFKKAS